MLHGLDESISKNGKDGALKSTKTKSESAVVQFHSAKQSRDTQVEVETNKTRLAGSRAQQKRKKFRKDAFNGVILILSRTQTLLLWRERLQTIS